MTVSGEIAVPSPEPMPVPRGGVAAVRESMEALKAIRTFIKEEFRRDLDFGLVPGAGGKSTLFQPGAQKIVMYFNAAPDHEVRATDLGDGHVEYLVTTRLIHRGTGAMIGSGVGSCCTLEKKYRFRSAQRRCPRCGKEAIFKAKPPQRGWYCWAKKDGCGAQFGEGEPAIVSQAAGDVANPDIYDMRNTVLKMATKRSLVSAAISLACASELFTQDIEDTYAVADEPAPARPAPRPKNHSGHKTGQYASDEQVEAYRRDILDFCAARNAEWLDRWTSEHGELAEGIGDVVQPAPLTCELFAALVRRGQLAEVPMTAHAETGEPVPQVSAVQAKRYVAIVHAREPDLVLAEAGAIVERLAEAARAAWYRDRKAAVEAADEAILATEGGRDG